MVIKYVPFSTNSVFHVNKLRFADSIASAIDGADLIIEAVPERLDIKQSVYHDIEAAAADTLIASSTSGILPSDLQAHMAQPDRLLVAHPFNPVYLLPLVELVKPVFMADWTVLVAALVMRTEASASRARSITSSAPYATSWFVSGAMTFSVTFPPIQLA